MVELKVFVFGVLLLVCLTNAAIFVERRTGIPPPDVPNPRARAPVLQTIAQKLDHFNEDDSRSWNMRYYYNNQFYKSGGPIFIYIGGEWTIDPGWLQSGQMFDMARQHGGYMFYTEHRFYGDSFPLGDLTTESLKYIRSQQSLADLAHFIRTMKETIPGAANSKVVVVGASYSASMATWMRIIYPDLVDIAYASSAPLIALEDFYQYEEVVGDNIALNDPECYKILNEGTAQMETYFKSASGLQYLATALRTCNVIDTSEPYKAYLYNQISVAWSNLVQYAKPGQIAAECAKVTSKTGNTSFERLAAYIREKNGRYCIGDYDYFISFYANTELSASSSRPWTFQTCEEFGFFQTTSSKKQPFGQHVMVDFYHHMCRDIFGQEYTPEAIAKNIEYTNSVYGGINPNMSYVVSVHGTVDPWHSIGLTSDLNDLAPAFLVQVSSVFCVALAHWEPVHEKYHGPLHYPKIYKGVPIEPKEVQHAREAHLKAVSEIAHHGDYHHNEDYHHGEEYHHGDDYHHGEEYRHEHEEHQPKWHGPLHYPKIHKGVPVEPLAVQHARAEHLEAVHGHHGHDSHAYQHSGEDYHHGEHGYAIHQQHAPIYGHNDYHHETIGHDGTPMDTPEVQHAKAAHFAAYHKIAHAHHH